MKKFLFALVLCFGLSQTADAQLQFGVKGGINYNSNSFQDVKNDVLDGAKSKTGYHAGIWFRAKLPIIGLYLRPELVYTQLNNDVNYDDGVTTTRTNYKFSKIDIPVLLGTKILGIGNVFIGPSFQYILSSDFGINDLREISSSDFSVGLQFGGGIEIGRLGLDVRWERGLGKNKTVFNDDSQNAQVDFNTRVNQIIVGLSIRL